MDDGVHVGGDGVLVVRKLRVDDDVDILVPEDLIGNDVVEPRSVAQVVVDLTLGLNFFWAERLG